MKKLKANLCNYIFYKTIENSENKTLQKCFLCVNYTRAKLHKIFVKKFLNFFAV